MVEHVMIMGGLSVNEYQDKINNNIFKIISIIFMMIVIYQIYQLNCTVYKDNREDFEGTVQSINGIDDANAINTLAQIAKQLMTGGVTVPGALDVRSPNKWGLALSLTGGEEPPYMNFMNKADGKRNGYIMGAPDKFILSNNVEVGGSMNAAGNLGVGGNVTVGGNGSIATGGVQGQTKGTIISNMGDSWGMLWGSECALIGQKGKPMRFGFADAYNAAGWDEKMRIQPDGSLIVQGRNILAELDQCLKINRGYYMKTGTRADGADAWGNGQDVHTHSNGNVALAGGCCATAYSFRPQ